MQTLWGLNWSLSPTTPRRSYVFNALLSQMPLLLLLPSFPTLVDIPPLLFFPSCFHCPCWLYFLKCLYCPFHGVSGSKGINTCIPFARFNQRDHQCDIWLKGWNGKCWGKLFWQPCVNNGVGWVRNQRQEIKEGCFPKDDGKGWNRGFLMRTGWLRKLYLEEE